MVIKTLVENTSISSKYKSAHGLSIYIETEKHKILFDLGPNKLFYKNAKKLGIRIADIDTVIISHGHADHAGALSFFLKHNDKAKIYIRKSAFDKHIVKVLGIPFNVSLDRSLKDNHQIVFTQKLEYIDDELILFSEVTKQSYFSANNMYTVIDDRMIKDDFSHEQNLIVMQDGEAFLFAGCAHASIVNIKDYAERLINKKVLCIFGGFHLFNHVTKKHVSRSVIDDIANMLQDDYTQYYTCHCTGKWAYSALKDTLKDSISYIATGTELRF